MARYSETTGSVIERLNKLQFPVLGANVFTFHEEEAEDFVIVARRREQITRTVVYRLSYENLTDYQLVCFLQFLWEPTKFFCPTVFVSLRFYKVFNMKSFTGIAAERIKAGDTLISWLDEEQQTMVAPRQDAGEQPAGTAVNNAEVGEEVRVSKPSRKKMT